MSIVEKYSEIAELLDPSNSGLYVQIDSNGSPKAVSLAEIIMNAPPTTPSISTPNDGSTNVSTTPTINASAFSMSFPNGDTFIGSNWQIATDVNFTNIVENATLGAVTSHVVGIILNFNKTYYARVRYKDSSNIWSNWSTPISFTTMTAPIPTQADFPGSTGFSINTAVKQVTITYANPGTFSFTSIQSLLSVASCSLIGAGGGGGGGTSKPDGNSNLQWAGAGGGGASGDYSYASNIPLTSGVNYTLTAGSGGGSGAPIGTGQAGGGGWGGQSTAFGYTANGGAPGGGGYSYCCGGTGYPGAGGVGQTGSGGTGGYGGTGPSASATVNGLNGTGANAGISPGGGYLGSESGGGGGGGSYGQIGGQGGSPGPNTGYNGANGGGGGGGGSSERTQASTGGWGGTGGNGVVILVLNYTT